MVATGLKTPDASDSHTRDLRQIKISGGAISGAISENPPSLEAVAALLEKLSPEERALLAGMLTNGAKGEG